MPALDLMPFGVRCAPWSVWLACLKVQSHPADVGAKDAIFSHAL